MTQIAFTIDVLDYSPSQIATADVLHVATDIVRQVRNNYPATHKHGVDVNNIVIADVVVANPTTDYTSSGVKVYVNPAYTDFSKGIHAGATAGNLTMTGVDTSSVLVSVIGVDPNVTTRCIDFTSQFAVCGTNTIGNAGGSTTANCVVIATWYA